MTTLEAESGWQPIETAPKDGTKVDLKQGDRIARRCWWGLCDRGWGVMGVMAWTMAPTDMNPTEWTPHRAPEPRS